MNQVGNMLTEHFFGGMAQSGLEDAVGELQSAVGAKNCDQFVGGIEQSGKLLSPKNEPRLPNTTLGHGLFASQLAEKQSAAGRTFGSLPESGTRNSLETTP